VTLWFLSVVGVLSDALVRCGDVLNIHCSVGSALRVTSCQLIRADNDSFHPHHSHLYTCSLSQHQPNTTACDEYQPTKSHDQPITELVAGSHDLPITELLAESHDPPITSVDNRLYDAEETLVSVEPRRVQSTQVDWFYLDRAVIGQLNDVLWTDSCLTALRQLMNIHQFPRRLQLIISSPTPLMFPFAALRLGLVSDLCFLDLDPVQRPLIGRLLAANEVGGEEAHVTYGCPWQRDVSAVLFADIVSSEGCMRQNVFDQLYATR